MWGGTILLSGIVSVTATVAGSEQTVSRPITVTPRNWSAKLVDVAIATVATPFNDPPDSVQELGSNLANVGILIDRYSPVDSGPNAGLAYFTDLPFKLRFEVNYNTKALNASSRFYQMQPKTDRRVGTVTYCGQGHILGDIPMIMQHEGSLVTDTDSHTDSFTNAFLTVVRTAAEKVVVDPNRLDPGRLADSAYAIAHQQSHQVTDLSNRNPYKSNCVLNYAEGDDQMKRHSQFQMIALALLMTLSAPSVARAQEEMTCDKAARILAKGHPEKKEPWAFSVMMKCSGGAAALASLWTPPPADSTELDALVAASLRLADQRLLDSAVAAFRNTALPLATRRVLVNVILGEYQPGLSVSDVMWSEPEKWILSRRFDVTQHVGEFPIGDADRARIRALFTATATTDPDPLVRRVAARVAATLQP